MTPHQQQTCNSTDTKNLVIIVVVSNKTIKKSNIDLTKLQNNMKLIRQSAVLFLANDQFMGCNILQTR